MRAEERLPPTLAQETYPVFQYFAQTAENKRLGALARLQSIANVAEFWTRWQPTAEAVVAALEKRPLMRPCFATGAVFFRCLPRATIYICTNTTFARL